MTIYHIIKPDDSVESLDWGDKPLEYGCIPFSHLKHLIGGYVEHVSVHWQGRRHHMFVDENGHSKGLKANRRATRIYWNATFSRKHKDLIYSDLSQPTDVQVPDDPDFISGLPLIVGVAVLWEGDME